MDYAIIIGVLAPLDLGAVTFVPEKNTKCSKGWRLKSGCKHRRSLFYPSDETAIIVKIAQLQICILTSTNSPNETSDTSKISTASMPSVCTFQPELSGGSELYFVFNSVTVTGWIPL